MKKFYVIVLITLISGYVAAQSVNKTEKRSIQKAKYFKGNASADMKQQILKKNDYIQKKSKFGDASRWYNYADAVNAINFPNGGNLLNIGRLFPDTTVLIKYSNGDFPPWIHSACTILDPLSTSFTSDELMNLNTSSQIKVDSIELLAYYRRHIPTDTIVDTLIVEVLQGVRWRSYFLGMNDTYGFDTLKFVVLDYEENTVDYKDPGPAYITPVVKFKIPLTAQSEADTTDNGLNVIRFAVPDMGYSPVNRGVGVTIRFKPGYSWTPYESYLTTELNEFSILSYEESGDGEGEGTFPIYWPGEWNTSYIVPNWALFDTANSWHGSYVPTWAFVQKYVYENHYIWFHLMTNNDGITENAEKSVKLSQNIPNPADNSTLISYELMQANNVNFIITDLSGKKVMEIHEGKQMAGAHVITVNTDNLGSGMYYYTLYTDNASLTRKMIVCKK